MTVEIPIQGQSVSGGNSGGGNTSVQSPIPPVQPPTQPPVTPNWNNPIPPPPMPYIQQQSNDGSFPSNGRMVEDVRREMQQRGVLMVPGSSSMHQIINQYGSNLRKQTVDDINSEYSKRGQIVQQRRDDNINNLNDWVSKEFTRIYHKYGDDDDAAKQSNEFKDLYKNYKERKDAYNEQYKQGITTLNEEKYKDIEEADKDLTKAIRDLTRYFEREAREGVNEDSFLNKLKKEREKAIFERDNADDEETAREASKRVNELNEQIKSVTEFGEEEPEKKDFGARILQMMTGVNQFVGGLTSKNLGQMITGTGALVTNFLPLSDENQATAMKWLSGAGFIGSLIGQAAQREDSMAGLASVIRLNGQSIKDARESLTEFNGLYNYSPNDELPGIFTLGMDEMGFGNSAERRISQSGIGGWEGVKRAYYQEALERALSLQSGSLGSLSQYDIYGITSTNGFAALMKTLEEKRGSRVYGGNYAASELYLQIQQGLMQSQMDFAYKPDYNYSNFMISALETNPNYIADSRTLNDIQSVQNSIQNPQNDRQRAILYSVIEKMYPKTRGRMDLIERTLQDPNELPYIYEGYFNEIKRMYGGSDTEMGYFAIKSLFPGVGNAKRRDELFNSFTIGTENISQAGVSKGVSNFENEYVKMADNYHSSITNALNGTVDGIYTSVDKLVQGIEKVLNFLGL